MAVAGAGGDGGGAEVVGARCAVVLFPHFRQWDDGVIPMAMMGGHEDRRRLESHFGAWVICTEQTSPFQVTALDENGAVLGSIPYE